MRIRYIRPSITTCEELVELGPYAYILFQGLWMLADREGRFEAKPRRIKALCMPMWEEVTVSVVEILVEKLSKSGFIELYLIGGKLFGTIVNWSKHQRPHHSEGPSKIPETPRKPGRPKAQVLQTQEVAALTVGAFSPPPRPTPRVETSAATAHGEWGMVNGEWVMGAAALFVPGESEGTEEKSSPPLIEPKTPEPEKTKADPPPSREPADFGPHDIGSVNMLRESLTELGKLAGLSPPDDDILRQVLEAGHGARADDIHLEIVGMWKSGRLRTVRSWGLLPLVVGSAFT